MVGRVVRPAFGRVDEATADLLDLVANDATPLAVVRDEWATFTDALYDIWQDNIAGQAVGVYSGDVRLIDPNRFRVKVRGLIAPKRIGALTNRALRSYLLVWRGAWVESTDVAGRNAGKPCKAYILTRDPRRGAA